MDFDVEISPFRFRDLVMCFACAVCLNGLSCGIA